MVALTHKSLLRRWRETGKSEEELAAEREAVSRRLRHIVKAMPCGIAGDQDPKERRRSARKDVRLKGRLLTENLSQVDCEIVNLSADGARIAIAEGIEMTQFVELTFVKSGFVRKARVAWGHNNEYGLAFAAGEQISVEDAAA